MTSYQQAIAQTIWGEMRGAGHDAMVAVACVIMNRVAKKTWYGLTPYEVCHKPHQFSCWDIGDPNLSKILSVNMDDPQYADACEIAEDCTQFNWVDTTNKATHYFSGNDVPNWALGKTPCLTLANTRYYNDIS